MNNEQSVYLNSPVGCLKITATETHLRSVSKVPGESLEPQEPTNPILKETVKQLHEYFHADRQTFDLPLKQEGTPFQEKVWAELLKVPYGQSISYMELAARIGHPSAYRAVGNANGKNRICIIVPCHRIVQANGSLGGYAYGLEMKSLLLIMERVTGHNKHLDHVSC
jgi:methylated-DNA-[protein]-cysteine S-methyltransferase